MSARISRPYAKAFLAAAGGLDEGTAARDDLARLAEACRQVPEIIRMAANPGVARAVKESALEAIGGELRLGPLTQNLFDLLVKNYRLVHLELVLASVNEILDRRSGVVTAEITAARPLNEAQETRLRSVLERLLRQQVRLTLAENPELLGGFVARIGSRRYDASLNGQLNRLATAMAQP